jgi:hypothetical protein
MFLIAAFVFFAIFALNVALGSYGASPFLGDVGEMLLLFAASVAFVIAVMKREAATKTKDTKK